jgi:hypothetical protein
MTPAAELLAEEYLQLNTEQIGRLDRNTVRGGLSYLGICAGAFFAGASPYNGLNLTSGVRFPFYALNVHCIRERKAIR